MGDKNLDGRVKQQNRRKLQEHLEKIRHHGGVPPEEGPKPAVEEEGQAFRRDWEAWKRIFGGRIIDLSARGEPGNAADFKLLGIAPTSDKGAIRKAFYALAKKNHPDAGGSEENFRGLMTAYRNLTGEA